MEKRRLIVGLGNPGPKYEWTRHNLGFIVVREFAKKLGFSFKKESQFSGEIATGRAEMSQIYLLLPMTYMNLCGTSIRRVCDYYKIPFEDPNSFLVIVDDVYIPFGQMRLREEGSSGGHNGLKNCEAHLQTQKYARLRMGIGPKEDVQNDLLQALAFRPPLEDYVLGTFTSEEKRTLPQFVERGVSILMHWQDLGWDEAKKRVGEVSKSAGEPKGQ